MLDIFHKLPPQAKKFLETHGEAPRAPTHHMCASSIPAHPLSCTHPRVRVP